MKLAADILIALVALLHVYFLVLEMFLWDKPKGMKTFGLTPEKAALTKSLAMTFTRWCCRNRPTACWSAIASLALICWALRGARLSKTIHR